MAFAESHSGPCRLGVICPAAASTTAGRFSTDLSKLVALPSGGPFPAETPPDCAHGLTRDDQFG